MKNIRSGQAGPGNPAHANSDPDGHCYLHVARAGPRQAGRPPDRSLVFGRHPLRDADRTVSFPRGVSSSLNPCHPQQKPGAHHESLKRHPDIAGICREQMLGKGSVRALPDGRGLESGPKAFETGSLFWSDHSHKAWAGGGEAGG